MSRGLDGPGPAERPHPSGRRDAHGVRIEPAGGDGEPRRAVVSVIVRHEPGVLARVAGLFARRRFNIEELTVGAMDDEHGRITLVVREPEPGLRQVVKQLEKLLSVISAEELDSDAIRREIALVKVDGDEAANVKAVADMYGGRVVDASDGTVTVELTGSRQKVEAALDTFGELGVQEIARAGTVALERGRGG